MKVSRWNRRRLVRGLALGLGVMALSAPNALAVTAEQFIGPSPNSQNQQLASPDARDAGSHVGVYSHQGGPQVISPDATDARSHVGVYAPSTTPAGSRQPTTT